VQCGEETKEFLLALTIRQAQVERANSTVLRECPLYCSVASQKQFLAAMVGRQRQAVPLTERLLHGIALATCHFPLSARAAGDTLLATGASPWDWEKHPVYSPPSDRAEQGFGWAVRDVRPYWAAHTNTQGI
jgi:hypothetical protein